MIQICEPKKRHCVAKVREWRQIKVELTAFLDDLCHDRLRWPLFLYGPTGTGKSCAALCLVDRIPGAEFWPAPQFIAHVQAVRAGRVEWYKCGRGGVLTERAWWQQVEQMPLLVLDDIGLREVNPDHHVEALFLALQARDGLPLICTSNLDEHGIEDSYNARIRSRVCCGTVFELRGMDRRYPSEDAE